LRRRSTGRPRRLATNDAAVAAAAPSSKPQAAAYNTFNFLPMHVTFRGMPEPRWWNFEDGATDFGQLDTEHVDLAKMLVMEFTLVYGGDWFFVPVPTRSVDLLGERTGHGASRNAFSVRDRPDAVTKLSFASGPQTRKDCLERHDGLLLVVFL
jgi:hypothetical protein